MNFRAKKWVVNLRNANLDGQDIAQFHKTKHVCSEHFESVCYVNINDRSSSLNFNAVPTLIEVPNPPALITPKRKAPSERPNLPEKKSTIPLKIEIPKTPFNVNIINVTNLLCFWHYLNTYFINIIYT